MPRHQWKAPPVQFDRRLLAGEARGVSMAGAYLVILREVIAAGVAGGVLSGLRFVQSAFSG
jgi:hypothetical protein